MLVAVPFRLTAWILLVLSSAIAVISLLDDVSANADAWSFETVWTVILIAAAGGLAVGMSTIHGLATLRHHRVGLDHRWELATIVVTVLAWIMAIPVVMDPEKRLAIDETTNIIDANLYFSSWWGFMSALALFVFHGSESTARHVSREWACLAIASLVTTMAASHRIDTDCGGTNTDETSTCRSLRTAITLAVFSFVMSISVVLAYLFQETCARFIKPWVLCSLGLVELGIWTVLVAILTFKDGPAKQVGTLFFGTWISALLALYVSLQHVHGMFHPPQPTDDNADGKEDDSSEKHSHPDSWDASQNENKVDVDFPDIEMGHGQKKEKHDKQSERSDHKKEPVDKDKPQKKTMASRAGETTTQAKPVQECTSQSSIKSNTKERKESNGDVKDSTSTSRESNTPEESTEKEDKATDSNAHVTNHDAEKEEK